MQNYKKISGLLLASMLIAFGCNTKTHLSDAEILHQNEDKLTQLIIYDVFTPPVAARIYTYASLASYEAIRFQDSTYKSLMNDLNGFDKAPIPEKGKAYDYTLSATKAFFEVVRKNTFSVDSLDAYESKIYKDFKERLDDSTFNRSIAFGKEVAAVVNKRASTDNYPQTRSKPKLLGYTTPGKWHPTPPDYLDAVEYCWGDMKTLVLDSSAQFAPVPPPPFNDDENSEYMKQNKEVYDQYKALTPEQIEIAHYWDDNPFVMEHSGHMSFANKKITPGGHWIGITAIACKQVDASAVKTARAYALTSIALFDSFIACWQEKYTSNYIRPVTVINDKIDVNWLPLLQTPPFPEYPSGHSAITRSAAVLLTHVFGDNFAFQDTSDLAYIGMQRHFDSFVAAADEASISRFYGGIHYLNSVTKGAEQGRKVSEFIIKKLKL